MKKGLDNASNLKSLVTLPKKRISRLKTSQGINVWRVYTRETHSKDYLFLRKTRHESHSSYEKCKFLSVVNPEGANERKHTAISYSHSVLMLLSIMP